MHRAVLSGLALTAAALAVAGADSIAGDGEGDSKRGPSLILYRTRMAPGAAYGGYSYASYDGTDFRDFALATEHRRVDLKRGINVVRIAGVPASVDNSTVSLRSLTDPAGTVVLEQRFIHDLADGDRPLDRARGHAVLIRTQSGTISGQLLSYDSGQVTLRTKDEKFPLRMIQRRAILDLQIARSANLTASPTLEWKVRAARAGPHDVELSYRAHQITWSADYSAVYDPDSERVDLSAYATVYNKTGADFRGADIQLVHRTMAISNYGYGAVATLDGDPRATQAYKLRRRVSVLHGESVQLDLFPPLIGRQASTVLVYEATAPVAYTSYPNTECYSYSVQPTRKTSNRYLEIDPGAVKINGSFPPGKARVFRRTSRGPLELVSEENLLLDSSSSLRIKVGVASQVAGMRKQLDCRHNEQARELREKIELTIKNKSKRKVNVVLREYMNRWPTWTIESESESGQETGGVAQEYRISLGPSATKTLNYTVVYSW